MFAARFDPSAAVESSFVEPVPQLKRKRETESPTDDEDEDEEEVNVNQESSESADESQSESEPDLENEPFEEGSSESKHSSVLNRFQQTLSLQDALKDSEKVPESGIKSGEDADTNDAHNLAPIPQPARVPDKTIRELDPLIYKSTAWDTTTKVFYDNSMVKEFTEYKDRLDERLLKNIVSGFSPRTFPIQTIILDTILPVLNSSYSVNKKRFTRQVGDILVNASTGSGKTLAYSIPLIQVLRNRTVNRLRAVILVPTKLLIHQVYECMSKLSQGTSLIISMSKLENSLKEEHNKYLQDCPDVLIITPGRLVDHLQMGSFDLKALKFLVLDEADRLLNQSFQNWNQLLFHHLANDKEDKRPGNVIKMIFSATLTTNAEKLHNLHLHNPKIFLTDTVKLYTIPKQLQELHVQIPTAKSLYKPLVLLRILHEINKNLQSSSSRILVFVKSNEASIRLTGLLNQMLEAGILNDMDISLASINSNNAKSVNKKLIRSFASKKTAMSVMISTDVMSRGIDINEVTHVINYDLPMSSQQYVHRCGRTARANMDGIAINLFVGKGEHKFFSEQIDPDLSRDVDGNHPRPFKDDEAQLHDMVTFEEGLDQKYKECIRQLQTR